MKALAALGTSTSRTLNHRPSTRCAAPPLRSGPSGDCLWPSVRETLAGQPEGWPAFDCPEVRRRGAAPLSRTNVHVYTDADGNRAVGLSPPLRLDRSADRFRGPLRNGAG